MGNKESQERSLNDFMNSPQFQNNRNAGIYSSESYIPAYPGAHHDDEDTSEDTTAHIKTRTEKAAAVKNDFFIDKTSVKLGPTNDPETLYLSFKFSSTTDVEITIFYLGKETVDVNDNTKSIFVDTKKYPAVKSFIYGPVKDQEFPASASLLETKRYTKDELTKPQVTEGIYPLIIKMVKERETKTDRVNVPKKCLYTYFYFVKKSDKYDVKFLKQKFEYNGYSYILDDIYGIANSELNTNPNQEAKDCIICMTDKMNTIILPCKHMCLCLECAENLKKKSSKCPMCRTAVENFKVLNKF